MQPAIEVEHLSKQYRVSQLQGLDSYRTLRESLADAARSSWGRIRALTGRWPSASTGSWRRDNDFFAVDDVSFEVAPGEVVGIIGRNGAGKSTLLKILSRVTEPTSGRAVVHGRMGSLLEVGTGFHPELTGRENVFMNGSILGMSRREIARNFDAIVAFAELDQFIDTPVKRYSSGMYVRLAFAVAAHLDPEILLIDEVIAVGDADFQRRCLRKVSEIAKSGRTVLFVSHSMAAIKNICTRAFLFRQGRLTFSGNADAAVAAYLESTEADSQSDAALDTYRAQGMSPVVQKVELLDEAERTVSHVAAGGGAVIRIAYDSPRPLTRAKFLVIFETLTGERLFSLHSAVQHSELAHVPSAGVVSCAVPCLPLVPGTYKLTFLCALPNLVIDHLERALTVEITASDFFGTGCLPKPEFGRVLVPGNWDFAENVHHTARSVAIVQGGAG